ncbi:hypothetical protein EON66_10795 [archaeon]|nr:MAG: hypothetical protein EON66_10795 [archaeon]
MLLMRSYAAAADMKKKADELAVWEEERWNKERQDELLARENTFKSKLRTELEAVTNRLAQQRADLTRTRQKDLENLLIRYANAKSEIERQHKMEKQRFDKEMSLELKLIRGQAHKLAY